MAIDVINEVNEAKTYAKGAEAVVKNLIEIAKISEPQRSGFLNTIEQLNIHLSNIEQGLKKAEPKPEPQKPAGSAKIDARTGIKKVV